jgi:hypothetical protein
MINVDLHLNVYVPPLLPWHVAQIVFDVPSFVVKNIHWLFSDVLHSTLTMNTKLLEELQNHFSFGTIMDEDFGMANELTLMASNTHEKCMLFWIHFFVFFLKMKKAEYIIF